MDEFPNGLQALPRMKGCTEATHPSEDWHPNGEFQDADLPPQQHSPTHKAHGKTSLHLAEGQALGKGTTTDKTPSI